MNNVVSQKSTTLHITSDSNTARHLEASLTGGFFLAWQDALYEGPIDAESDLSTLSTRRAVYFVGEDWTTPIDIHQRYQIRNEVLQSYQQYGEVILWFEHDLNSQLQLVQLMDWFARQQTNSTVLSLVSIEGLMAGRLNSLSCEDIQSLLGKRWEITLGQMNLSQNAWRALSSDNPNALLRFCGRNSSAMPYLTSAIWRYLKQFPALSNGLSHSEFLIVNALLQQGKHANSLYFSMQDKEALPFVNEAIYTAYIKRLCKGPLPLIVPEAIQGLEDEDDIVVEQQVMLGLTDLGRQVLHNWVDWIQVSGIHRWLGGVELTDGCLWRYDESRRKLIQTYV